VLVIDRCQLGPTYSLWSLF